MYPHRIRLHGPWNYEPQSRTVVGPDGTIALIAADRPEPGRLRIPATWRGTPLDGFRGLVRWSRRFHAPRSLEPDERVWITFGGVDYFANVSLNGQPVGCHEGYFEPFEFDVTSRLAPANELIVDVDCPAETVLSDPRLIRGALDANAPEFVAGLWRDVAIEIRSIAFLSQVSIRPVLENGCGIVHIEGSIHGSAQVPLHLNLAINDVDVERQEVADGGTRFTIRTAVPEVEPWWPASLGSGRLYSIRLELVGSARTLDTVQWRVGFRDLQVDGQMACADINGRTIATKTIDITPPDCPLFTDWRLHADVFTKSIDPGALALLRVPGRVMDPSVYDWADEHGILLVQDIPSVGRQITEAVANAEAVRQAQAIVRLLGHHPSVALFQERIGWK